MNTDMPLGRRLLISTTTLVTVAALLYVLVARPFEDQGVRVEARFGRAGQSLGKQSQVKVRGVSVGSVSKVALNDDGTVEVVLRLDKGVRIPDSVTAAIEPASVFGPKSVNLIPGGHEANGPFLADGAHIARTSDPKDLSDVLGDAGPVVSAIDAKDVSVIVRTLATGIGGEAPRLRATVDDVDTLSQVAYRRRDEARQFLGDGADVATTLAGSGDDLTGIAGNANTLISDLAAGRQGRLGDFSVQLGRLSGLIGHGLDKRGAQIGEAFRSSERVVAVFYAQLGLLGKAVRSGNQLLPIYDGLTNMQGPGGKHYVGAIALLPTNPCQLIVGVCPSGGR
ncbi:MCE family protein [Actinomadura barringtoniae]|uniref:MCE family protein n=1 Tax=Actinomadura barringtoniae TaxID=1427535 RepID=A0A939T1H3_9ACTN|nr:MlaD family protein [Actinomadura barringtoniae]MBO2447591.1 MCE family protein [Actinomadura barringtoniae]